MAKGGYRGNPMGGGINMNMIKQAQKMQQDMLKMQEEMENKEYDATVGGGMVKAVVNGKHTLLSVEINPEAVDPEDVEMLQDLVVAAVNEAMRKAESEASANMSKLTGSLNLGNLGGLF
ncbi:MAG: YbaB/EbfC family nucleoid-associated protein [Oscillospiraceae bacterium]|nr:YbaB/EbfC family nucleoid-associated protein [Oscillospiraceae bacterium]MBR7010755.1 YbaB/EbfC family nucleoid-associated protein [Oscillospiraceae bacterium]